MKSIAACARRTSARAQFRLKNCAPNASRGFLSEIQDLGTGVGFATSDQHNLLGQRVRKLDASQNTITLYSEAEQGMESMALGLYNSQAATGATEIIYLPTASGPMPLAALVKGTQYAIHSDHLNTPRRLTQTDGKVAWQWVTGAFGEVASTTGKTRFVSPKVNPAITGTTTLANFDLRYPGQVEDQESGLLYNHNRFYDPVTGRYMQSDPIGLAGGSEASMWVPIHSTSRIPKDWTQPS
jgi:RHS repeat-associated protein